MIDLLQGALDGVERVLAWIIAALMLCLVVVVASQLVDRHVITLPMAAPDQYARVMLVWITFIGFALAVKNGLNIRVDLIDQRLPVVVRRALDTLFDLAMIVLSVIVGWNGWRLVVIGADQERLGTVLTEAWPSVALFGSCVLMVLFLVLRIAVRLAGREPPRASALDAE